MKDTRQLHAIPEGLEGKLDTTRRQSFCPDGAKGPCCVDVYPSHDGSEFTIVNERGHLTMSAADFHAIGQMQF